jgi:hypothetical protein
LVFTFQKLIFQLGWVLQKLNYYLQLWNKGRQMLTTVQLIEMIGRDASLRDTSTEQLENYLLSQDADPTVVEAITTANLAMLSNLISAGSRGCYLLVPTDNEEEEKENGPDKKDVKVNLQ